MGRLILACIGAAFLAGPASAQIPMPAAAPMTGEALFKNQCGVCHTVDPNEPPRQGPVLKGVYERKPGTYPNFKYSAGFAKADWVWDEDHLNTWLTNPQAMIPGAVMLYRQAKPDVRAKIISYLKDQK